MREFENHVLNLYQIGDFKDVISWILLINLCNQIVYLLRTNSNSVKGINSIQIWFHKIFKENKFQKSIPNSENLDIFDCSNCDLLYWKGVVSYFYSIFDYVGVIELYIKLTWMTNTMEMKTVCDNHAWVTIFFPNKRPGCLDK